MGVVLWAAATVLGAVVGLLRGNELYLVAGQVFSMALLPYAFFTARSLDVENRPRVFSTALVGAVVAACLLQFGYWAFRSLFGVPLLRLALPNSLSTVGASIMALIVAITLAARENGRTRLLGLTAIPIIGVSILGSGTRSAVLAAALAVAIMLLVVGAARKGLRGLATVVVLVATAGLVAFAVFAAIWNAPRDSAVPLESFLEPFWVAPSGGDLEFVDTKDGVRMEIVWKVDEHERKYWISLPYPVDPEGMFRISAEIKGEGTGTGWVDFTTFTPSLEECSHRTLRATAGAGWRRIESAVLTEFKNAPVVRVRVGGDKGAIGTWRARNVRLDEYKLILPRSLQRNLIYLYDRIVTSWEMFRFGKLSHDPSMRVRIKETLAARDQVRDASLVLKVFGHGLGARLEFEEPGFNALAQRIVFKNPNYIHNFYAFLAFKLGAVGGLAILVALGAWIFRSVQMVVRNSQSWGAEPGAASLAVWIAYAAWGVFCPQFIDFADAPLFGFFLACWVAAEHSSARGEVPSR